MTHYGTRPCSAHSDTRRGLLENVLTIHAGSMLRSRPCITRRTRVRCTHRWTRCPGCPGSCVTRRSRAAAGGPSRPRCCGATPGGPHGGRHLEHASAVGTIRVRCGDLSASPSGSWLVSAWMTGAGWQSLSPGELLHVDGNWTAHSPNCARRASRPLPRPGRPQRPRGDRVHVSATERHPRISGRSTGYLPAHGVADRDRAGADHQDCPGRVPTAAEAVEMVEGRACLVDGTITPCWSYAEHRELWSRKQVQLDSTRN
jgi:hypothetical protein